MAVEGAMLWTPFQESHAALRVKLLLPSFWVTWIGGIDTGNLMGRGAQPYS